jgi:hypothetical protein
MIRFILWLIVLYLIFKIIRIVTNVKQHSSSDQVNIDIPEPQSPSFDNIQDAEFEDLTPKPPPSSS